MGADLAPRAPEPLPAGNDALREGEHFSNERLAVAPIVYAVTTQVILLNGGSSAGKSAIVRNLQAVLPQPWLAIGGVDSLIGVMPESMMTSEAGIKIASDGGVTVGPEFLKLQTAWREGIASMARAGARVIIDDVLLGGAESQQEWQKVLGGLDVLWVGVRCDGAVAAQRERARGDRVLGMAEAQAEAVHDGMVYGLEVDTTRTESLACAKIIAAYTTASR
ncbi:chloramphenicol phosphotransferase CPT [Nonomuraea sp. NPDC000554]|uniref:chloramphenicol phosphotransferase CPT n=1 Tax=Nonomuraea sp. NPDC000554 TaxID=3154259 RepID=UPI003331AE1A